MTDTTTEDPVSGDVAADVEPVADATPGVADNRARREALQTRLLIPMLLPISARIAVALGSDWKGKLSPTLYLSGVALAFVHQALADALYVLVAVMWFIPDRRLARAAGDK